MPHDTTTIVFSKAPVPGRVKTRLIPRLGAEGAAALHAELLRHSIIAAATAALGPVELWCSPSPDHPLFRALAATHGLTLHTQASGDLGHRMHAGLELALAKTRYALLIGSDCPGYSAAYLQAARAALASGDDAVLGPAIDGGYVLIGLARNDRQLFSDIAWGGDTVLTGTRTRLERLGWRFRELETLADVDRPEDIGRVPRTKFLGLKLRMENERRVC